MKALLTLVVISLVAVGLNAKENSPDNWDERLVNAIIFSDFKGVKESINKGADLNYKGKNGSRTPVILAVKSGRLDILKYLLEKGADIKAVDDKGNKALLHSVNHGNYYEERDEIFRFLLEQGLDINHRNRSGYSALHLASLSGNFQTVKALVENGAIVDILNNNNETPLALTIQRHHTKMTETEMLRVAEAIDNYQSNNSENKIVDTLLTGMQKNLKKRNTSMKKEIVQEKPYNQHFEVINFLIKNGASVNHLDKYGRSIFYRSVHFYTTHQKKGKMPDPRVIKLLLEKGAKVNTKDKNGKTAIDLIQESNWKNKADILEIVNAHLAR